MTAPDVGGVLQAEYIRRLAEGCGAERPNARILAFKSKVRLLSCLKNARLAHQSCQGSCKATTSASLHALTPPVVKPGMGAPLCYSLVFGCRRQHLLKAI